jgi:Isochorismatase family
VDAILILDQARWRCAKDRVEQQLAPAAAIRRNINCALTQRYCVMLAISQRSVVVLVNPSLSRLTRLPAQFRSRVEISRVLLRHFAQVAGVSLRLLGDIGDAAASFRSLANCQIVAGDPVSFWRDNDVSRRLGPPDTQVIYVGGAWLDQDVLAAALSAVHIGYDTRVLVDVSIALTYFDRAWALERLEQHHVLMTTMRQTMTEWSLAAQDENISRQLRNALQQ